LTAAETAAARALEHLYEVSPDMRGGAILDANGSVLAASTEVESWAEPAKRLLAAADSTDGGAADQVHVATEDGEVFAVRAAGLVALAVTERFALASLMSFDMRAALRDLAAPAAQGAG
jgi:predicted regulator of Ras-like GTPase activity (Roadblock/LC7/MglB family)